MSERKGVERRREREKLDDLKTLQPIRRHAALEMLPGEFVSLPPPHLLFFF